MKNKEFIFLIVMISSSITMYSQKIDSEEVIDCIKDGTVNFFIDLNRLEKKDNSNKLYGNIGLIEISENKNIGYNLNGIYRITNFSSHRADYLLLKKGSRYKILSLINLTTTFNDITFFLEDLDYSIEDKLKYLELVMKEIKTNYELKWDDSIKPREQEWVSCE